MSRKIISKDEELVEQDSPLKNTDNAFVKVSRDGSPLIPGHPENDEEGQKQNTSAVEKDKSEVNK